MSTMSETFVVAPQQDADGATWLGCNSDREPNEAQLIEHLPARRARKEALRVTHIDVEDEGAMDIVVSRAAWMWGAEMGVNRAGVAIARQRCLVSASLQPMGLTAADLVRLALERAPTARAAVDVIFDLLGQYGQGGRMSYSGHELHSSAFLIADATDRFVLETAGRDAAAGTAMGIRRLGSTPTLRDAQWLRTPSSPHDFAARYGSTRIDVDGTHRQSRLEAQLREPSLSSMIAVLSDHHGQHPHSCSHAGPWPREQSGQTTASMIVRLHPQRAPQLWATGTSSPCRSVFKPIPFAGDAFRLMRPADERPDDESLFWRHERLHRQSLLSIWPAELEEQRSALQRKALTTPDGDANQIWEEHRRLLPAWLAAIPTGRRRWWSRSQKYWRDQSAALGWRS
jgi:secernin